MGEYSKQNLTNFQHQYLFQIILTGTKQIPGFTSWEIDGETVETVSDFTFLGSKITAVTIWNDFGAQENKVSDCFHCFPICHEVIRPNAIIFVF